MSRLFLVSATQTVLVAVFSVTSRGQLKPVRSDFSQPRAPHACWNTPVAVVNRSMRWLTVSATYVCVPTASPEGSLKPPTAGWLWPHRRTTAPLCLKLVTWLPHRSAP